MLVEMNNYLMQKNDPVGYIYDKFLLLAYCYMYGMRCHADQQDYVQ